MNKDPTYASLRERQEDAQRRLSAALEKHETVSDVKSILDELETLNKARTAIAASGESRTILKFAAVIFLVAALTSLGFAIRLSAGRVTVDSVVTSFDAKTAIGGRVGEAPRMASSIQVMPASLEVTGATINLRQAVPSDRAMLAKMMALTEFGPHSPKSHIRISSPKPKCYEVMVLDGEWRVTASSIDSAGSASAIIALPTNGELSFCTPNGLELSVAGITWLGLFRPFGDTLPPTFATSVVSGTLQRERVSGERKLTDAERIELNDITQGNIELREHDRIKLSFSGYAGSLCSLAGTGSGLDRACEADLRPTMFDLIKQNPLLAQVFVAIAGIVGFAGTIAKFFGMKIPGISAAIIAAAVLLADARAIAAQDARSIVLNNLVRLTATLADGRISEGYGLVIGRRGDDIWLITAAHVVFERDRPLPPASIRATIGPPDCQTAAVASEPPFKPGRTDIALVALRVPLSQNSAPPIGSLPAQSSFCELWVRSLLSESAVPGEELRLIGYRGRLEVSPAVVRLGPDRSATGPEGSIGIAGLAAQEGDSGAPVASARGVIGIYIGTLGGAGYLLPIATIKDAISGQDAPWQLTYGNDPSPVHVRFCIEQTGTLRAELRLQGPTDAIRLDAKGCATAPRTTLRVNVADPTTQACEPGRIAPTRDNQTIIIACSAKLEGYWRLGSTDGLVVTALGAGRWHIAGLAGTSIGQISGEVQGSGSSAAGLVRSSANGSAQLSVALEASLRKLHVRIDSPQMGSQVFELSR